MNAPEDRTSYAVEDLSKTRSCREVQSEEDEDSLVIVSEYNGPSYSHFWEDSFVCEANTLTNPKSDSFIDDVTVSSIIDDEEIENNNNLLIEEKEKSQELNENSSQQELYSQELSSDNLAKAESDSKSSVCIGTNDDINSGVEFLSSQEFKDSQMDSYKTESYEPLPIEDNEEFSIIAIIPDFSQTVKSDNLISNSDQSIGIKNLFNENDNSKDLSMRMSSFDEKISYSQVLETILSALYQDVKHAQAFSTAASAVVTVSENDNVVHVRKNATSQTMEDENHCEAYKIFNTSINHKILNTQCDKILSQGIDKSEEISEVKLSRQIYDYYKYKNSFNLKGDSLDFSFPLRLLTYLHQTGSLNEFGDSLNMNDMLNFVLKDKELNKLKNIESISSFFPCLSNENFEIQNRDAKKSKKRLSNKLLKGTAKHLSANVTFTYYVTMNVDQKKSIDKCIIDCEESKKQNLKLSEILKLLNEFHDQEIVSRCVKKLSEIKDHIKSVGDKRLYEIQQAHNVKITIKDSSNHKKKDDSTCRKVLMEGNSFCDLEKTIQMIQQKIPILSPPDINRDDKSISDYPSNFDDYLKKAFHERGIQINKRKIEINDDLNSSSHSNPISLPSVSQDNSGSLKNNESPPSKTQKKYKFKRVMKVVQTNHTNDLFRQNVPGHFMSKRLLHIQKKYEVKFGKVEIKPDLKRDSKIMICVTVYYDEESKAQNVFNLLNLYVSQHKTISK